MYTTEMVPLELAKFRKIRKTVKYNGELIRDGLCG
jgi:hypothetical protein